jgi:hypothetical protein
MSESALSPSRPVSGNAIGTNMFSDVFLRLSPITVSYCTVLPMRAYGYLYLAVDSLRHIYDRLA